ncbi:GntR family transcriptional regulator [Sporolactobacillus sp. STCC-11]|uniref:GntR family transcriptional regulator n=1 Tax=Sporolactobacillus caesalpiniae TaxID=3230362 RepID=UPI003396D092
MDVQHIEIADYFIQAISQGLYQEGDRIPSEAELQVLFGARRSVLRRAVARLEETGWVTTRQGKGSFVTSRKVPIDYELSSRTAFSSIMKEKGIVPRAALLHWEKRAAKQREQDQLALSIDETVYALEILRSTGDVPLSITTTVMPAYLVPDLEAHLTGFHSLYALLSRNYQLQPRRLKSIVRAALPEPRDAQILNIADHAPILQIESFVTHRGVDLMEYSMSRIRGDLNKSCVTF